MGAIFTRDSVGLAEVLHMPQLAAVIHTVAVGVAGVAEGLVAGSDIPGADQTDVIVDDYVSHDRVASSVTLAGPLGRYLEARYGVLTAAAGDQGLEVRAKNQ